MATRSHARRGFGTRDNGRRTRKRCTVLFQLTLEREVAARGVSSPKNLQRREGCTRSREKVWTLARCPRSQPTRLILRHSTPGVLARPPPPHRVSILILSLLACHPLRLKRRTPHLDAHPLLPHPEPGQGRRRKTPTISLHSLRCSGIMCAQLRRVSPSRRLNNQPAGISHPLPVPPPISSVGPFPLRVIMYRCLIAGRRRSQDIPTTWQRLQMSHAS